MADSEYNYIPMYIRRTINNRPKDVVTAKYWNELFNLLITQGDHTAEAVANVRGVFRINVTYSDGVYSADKTFAEIKAAYDAGQQPFVVLTGGTFDLVYALANFDAPTDGSEPKFVNFVRYLVGDGILETEMLRVYSYTTGSGSNVVKIIDKFKMPTSLKNPNALTFTGGAMGSYDGSEPETVHIPVIPYEAINKNTAARHSHDNKTVLDGITSEKIAEWDKAHNTTDSVMSDTSVNAVQNKVIKKYVDEKATVLQSKSITDSGGHFTTDTVEGALQEIGAELAGINTLLGSGIQISFTIDDGSEVNTFSAVSGETWKEWVGTSRVISEISGLTLYCFSDDGIIFADEAGVNALGLNDVWVHGNETIVSGATYAIIPCGG